MEWFVLLDERTREGTRLPAGGPVHWAHRRDARLLAETFGRAPELYERRLATGDRCAVLWDSGAAVADVWFCLRRHEEHRLRLDLADHEGYVYDGKVVDGLRGRRLLQQARVAAGEDLAVDGITRLVTAVDAVNGSSLRAARRHGAEPFGSVFLVGILGVSLLRQARPDSACWTLCRGTWPLALDARRLPPSKLALCGTTQGGRDVGHD